MPCHEGLREPDGLEDLRPRVGGDGRDAHLGHHLEDALRGGLHVVVEGLPLREAVDDAVAHHLGDRVEGEVGIDGARPVADEERQVVYLAGLARLHEEGDARSLPLPHEVVVHCGGEQQGGDGGELGTGVPVGQHDDVGAEGDRLRDAQAHLLDGRLEARPAGVDGPEAVDRYGGEASGSAGLPDIEELGELVVVDDGQREHDLPAVVGTRLEQVPLRPDRRVQRRHELLADGVERRVRHLGEQL